MGVGAKFPRICSSSPSSPGTCTAVEVGTRLSLHGDLQRQSAQGSFTSLTSCKPPQDGKVLSENRLQGSEWCVVELGLEPQGS